MTDINGISYGILRYQVNYTKEWYEDTMEYVSGNTYRGVIPLQTEGTMNIEYYVIGIDSAGNDRLSETKTFTITGIKDIPDVFEFRLTSNFGKGRVIFKVGIPKEGNVELVIYDIFGRVVRKMMKGKINSERYSLEFNPGISGVYFYILKSDWKEERGKIVIVR